MLCRLLHIFHALNLDVTSLYAVPLLLPYVIVTFINNIVKFLYFIVAFSSCFISYDKSIKKLCTVKDYCSYLSVCFGLTHRLLQSPTLATTFCTALVSSDMSNFCLLKTLIVNKGKVHILILLKCH